jgi:hypothetical protein
MEPIINQKGIVHPKITITPTRFEIKIPTAFEASYAARVVAFAKEVATQLGVQTQALRGTVKVLGDSRLFVRMHKNNSEHVASFTENTSASN